MVPLLPGGHFSVKIAQQSCSGRTLWISLLIHIFSKCWFSSSCRVAVLLFLWFLKQKTSNHQFLRAKEAVVLTGSAYVDASDEGAWKLLLNV